MSSGARVYIPSFIKIVSGIQNLMGEGYLQTHSMDIAKPTLGK
jgi:hypothetical protein